MYPNNIVNFFTIAIILGTLVILWIRLKKDRKKRDKLVPILVLLFNGLVYCTARAIDVQEGMVTHTVFFTGWANILRLHTFFTIFILQVYEYLRDRIVRTKNGR
jgi:hypothetical protein